MIRTVLTDRKKQILKCVTDAYISTGEPVGSKHIQEMLGFAVSSATIRNEMADLESMGYLSQPHTSAGRIPTSRGYRVYVDSLMEDYTLSFRETLLLNSLVSDSVRDPAKIIPDMASLLSEMTGYAVVLLTRETMGTIEKFDGVYVNYDSFLLVMITSSGKAITKQLQTSFPITPEGIENVVEVLNDQLTKKELGGITMERMLALEEALGDYKSLMAQILKVIYDVMGDIGKYSFETSGIWRLLNYSEFDSEAIKELLREIETKDALASKMEDEFSDEVRCHIGSGKEGIGNASFVTCPFTLGKKTSGIACIIGPKRMDYAKVMARLEYIAKEICAVHGFKPTLPLIETKEK